jgi:TctA family transporter
MKNDVFTQPGSFAIEPPIGILPGFGGMTGMALSLPLTYNHDAPTALVSNYTSFEAGRVPS